MNTIINFVGILIVLWIVQYLFMKNKKPVEQSLKKEKLIGEMSFYVYENAKYEIGIKICEFDYQEKGLGRMVLSMLIEELFNMGAQLIFLDTNLNNTRAQHVYEKLGFKRITIHYDSWRNQLGELQSSVDYELTKDDFCNLK